MVATFHQPFAMLAETIIDAQNDNAPGGASERVLENWLAGVGEDTDYEFSISLLPTAPIPPKLRKRDRNRAERLRLAGGPKPSLRDRAVALAIERGIARTRDLTDIGVPRCYLARMCKEGLLIKVGYGLYHAADLKAV